MGNFESFLSSDCFSDKYKEIVKDVKAIEEKFEALNSNTALSIQYKNLFDNLLVKLENPQYINVDETMTNIRKILRKLKAYDEGDISEIETDIKNLAVKVSLFLYDDDNNERRSYLSLLKKRELQLINDCIALIDYHSKYNYNNLDPLFKSLRKTTLGSQLLKNEDENLYRRENLPILSNIIKNIDVQKFDLPEKVPKTSTREKVLRADKNIRNAQIDIEDIQQQDDEIPIQYQKGDVKKILQQKIDRIKHDVSQHTPSTFLLDEPTTISSKSLKPSRPPSMYNVPLGQKKSFPSRISNVDEFDALSELSDDESFSQTNLYNNTYMKPMGNTSSVSSMRPRAGIQRMSNNPSVSSMRPRMSNNPPVSSMRQRMSNNPSVSSMRTREQRKKFLPTQPDQYINAQRHPLSDVVSQLSNDQQTGQFDFDEVQDEDIAQEQSGTLQQRIPQENMKGKKNISTMEDDISQENMKGKKNISTMEDDKKFRLPNDDISQGQSGISQQQTRDLQFRRPSRVRQKQSISGESQQRTQDLNHERKNPLTAEEQRREKIDLLRQKLKAAQKLLKSERKKVKKERNLFKKKVEDSTKNILNFQKKQKKTSPTFQKLLQLMNK